MGAGLVAWWGKPENNTGKLMVVTGFLWFVGSLQGFEDPWVYSIASALRRDVPRARRIHLLLAFPSGPARHAARASHGVRDLLRDHSPAAAPGPSSQRPRTSGCTDCPENVLLIAHEPTVAAVAVVLVALLAIYVLALTARILLRRWRDELRRAAAGARARAWC